jgi:hypothetical protein
LLTVLDVAYTILCYDNDKDCWIDQWSKNRSQKALNAEPKYHTNKGARLVKFGCGWKKEGLDYYSEIKKEIDRLWKDEDFMHSLRGYWASYVEKNHASYYKRKRIDNGDDDDVENEEEEIEDCDCEIEV